MKNRLRTLIISASLLLMVGCTNLHQAYVEADIKTYRAVANDLVNKYNGIDDAFERKLKLNTVKTWGDRLEEALKHEDLDKLRVIFIKVQIPE